MTSQVDCKIYYSIAGGPFNISQIGTGQIAEANTILHIYTHDEASLPPDVALPPKSTATELSIPKPIKKGQFFNSESCCLFLNKAGQVLRVDNHFLFPIYMRRDVNDQERLHIRFMQQYLTGTHRWEDISVASIPAHHL